ncbi:hypothetical protein CRENBAI_018768 [Crenichthys baileyi]|uniref:Uncharacterized protein n=1 Tax=Crenichthys baileyi TaxID=28760 RepID=A0AAV9RT81_9TELE
MMLQVGCAVVAGILHFFYLPTFCWMCLEGIQLFRMVVLVFNTNFKTIYMMEGGYGVQLFTSGWCRFQSVSQSVDAEVEGLLILSRHQDVPCK